MQLQLAVLICNIVPVHRKELRVLSASAHHRKKRAVFIFSLMFFFFFRSVFLFLKSERSVMNNFICVDRHRAHDAPALRSQVSVNSIKCIKDRLCKTVSDSKYIKIFAMTNVCEMVIMCYLMLKAF